MKNLFSFLSILFLTTTLFSQETISDSISPKFQFEEETINYGKIIRNSDKIRTFVFTNIGKEPLIIEKIKSSCGCTIPEKPEDPIMPGEKGEIKVSYDTSRLGGFSKVITIFSNAENSRKIIKIKGYVTKQKSVVAKDRGILSNSI